MARPEITGRKHIADEASAAVSSAHRAPSLPPGAYSVEQFCRAHDISIGHFYALLKAGIGPRVMKVGIRTLISVEEAARWRAERTAASSESR
jgi:hypothetical protein